MANKKLARSKLAAKNPAFWRSVTAAFTGNEVLKGSGKIRGVLTKYDTDFQFIVRYESDIQLTLDRFDTSPPIVGTAIAYLGSFTENFESYSSTSPNNKIFPKYILKWNLNSLLRSFSI